MNDELPHGEVRFFHFESAKDGRPVQDWFNNLFADHRDEVKDRLSYLASLPSGAWEDPLFDPLIGEGGISEIRFKEIKCVRGKFCYRIYGFFGQEDEQGEESYNFLHVVNKDRRNDRHGKTIAKNRLRELQNAEATLQPFNMDSDFPHEEVVQRH